MFTKIFPKIHTEGYKFIVIAGFITIILFLIFRFAEINVLQRYFLFTISVVVILLAILGKFTSFVPNEFQIISYSFYQFGLAFGVYIISKRKIADPFDEIK